MAPDARTVLLLEFLDFVTDLAAAGDFNAGAGHVLGRRLEDMGKAVAEMTLGEAMSVVARTREEYNVIYRRREG